VTRIQPATARYTVEETADFLRMTIPARRAGQWMPWMGVAWIVATIVLVWSANRGVASTPLDARAIPFLVVGTSMVLGVGIPACAALLWMNFGTEEITVAGRTLLRVLRAGPLRVHRQYSLAQAKGFRVSPRHAIACSILLRPNVPLGLGRGSIHFELDGETRYLGSGLDETEGRDVLAMLVAHIAPDEQVSAGEALESRSSPGPIPTGELQLTLPAWRAHALVSSAGCGFGVLVSSLAGQSGLGYYFAAWGAAELLWLCLGREWLTIRGGELVRRIGIGPIGVTHTYRLAGVRNLRLARTLFKSGVPALVERMGSGGSVWFDNGKRLARLGAGLGEAQACQLAARIALVIGQR